MGYTKKEVPMPRAQTSKENYHSHIKGKKENTENEIVLNAIRKLQPCTGRMISQYTEIENSSVARSLNNLKKANEIEVYYSAKCRVTKKKAQYYKLYEPKVTEDGQINLF
jgi:hypothetical protein